ncbi:MAG: tetratricopeptide repeat protein [Candidatus Cloacimonetes bacterium]|nr:tetratricopeptide repeat protein [Candidatus Cloacimonadota bacterium]
MQRILFILVSSFLLISPLHARSLSKVSKSHRVNRSVRSNFTKVNQYFNQGRFKEAIAKLRHIIQSSKNDETEKTATFLLGKAFLLNQQSQLAKITFEHLNSSWPNHQYKKEADFLEIEREIKLLSNISSFDKGVKKILEFEPFGLDLDFFNFFTGFSKGFVFNDYSSIKKKLSKYFDSKDKDLKYKAILLDSLIETFDFNNKNLGTIGLKTIAQSDHLYFSHLSSLALMISYCSDNIEDLEGLKRLLPKNYQLTNVGQLNAFLLFQVTAYIHGDFKTANKIISKLSKLYSSPFKTTFKDHALLMQNILVSNKSLSSTLKLIETLKGYSAFHLTIAEYQKLLRKPLNPRIKANIHYNLAKIYQDDFSDDKLAMFHLKAAKRFPLVPEVKEEVQWRLIKLLPKQERESKSHEIANKDQAYTEAAIYQELSQNQLSPKLLDKYFNSLLKLNLDLSSKMFYLKKLAEVAEQNHQYLKARFFLMKLARYNLDESNTLLKKNIWKQKVFQSRLDSTLAEEPEKFHFEKGRYLLLLGNEKEGIKTLEGISKSKSLYAQKAKFELFIHNLQIMSLDDDQLANLHQYFSKNPDTQIQKSARDLLISHYTNLYQGYSTLEEKKKEEFDNQYLDEVTRFSKNMKRIFANLQTSNIQFEIRINLLRNNLKKAQQLFEQYLNNKNDLDSIKIDLALKLENKKFLQASRLSETLAKVDRSNQDYHLDQAFHYYIQEKFEKENPEKPFEEALTTFQRKYPHTFITHFTKQILEFAVEFPQNLATQRVILEYQDQILRFHQSKLYKIVDLYLSQDQNNSHFINLKIKILQKSPTFLSEEFLLGQLKNKSSIALNASIALANLYKSKPRLQENSNQDYLKQSLNAIVKKPIHSSMLNLSTVLNFHYSLLKESEYQNTIQKGMKSKQVATKAFYHEKYIQLLLKKKKYFRVKREMGKYVNIPQYPDYFKLIAFEGVLPHFSKSKDLQSLKTWLFKINSKNLSYEQKTQFDTIAQSINAKAVIQALKSDINWDDPQDPKNIKSFFRMAKLYRDELKDVPSTINIYNQMLEYFSSSTIQNKVKHQQKILLSMQKVYELEQSDLLSDRIEAALSWLEELHKPKRALDVLNDSQVLVTKTAEQSYIDILKIRAFNQLGMVKEAQGVLAKLPTKFSSFSEALTKQIQASQLIRRLPTIYKASPVQLIKLSNIYLDQLFDLDLAQQSLEQLNKIVKPYQWTKIGFPSEQYLKFYHVAMGKNQTQRAAKFLKKAIKNTSNKTTLSKIYYTLGAHYFIYEWNLKLAEVYFNASVRNAKKSQYSQLSLISLVSLYEEQGKQNQALKTIQTLKSVLGAKGDTNEVESKELTLKKNIALSKISKYLDKLDQDPKVILKTAKSLSVQKDYYKEAEDKLLLYLRLVQGKKEEELAHQELGKFYLKNKKLSLATKQINWTYKNGSSQQNKFDALLDLIQIYGLEMQNFQRAFALVRESSKLLPNSEQSTQIQQLKQKVITLKKSQKRLSLKTLSYNHFPLIKSIKKKYYKKKQYKEGAKKLEDLIDSTENFQLKVGVYYELSRLYDLKLKEYKQALKYYRLFFSSMNNPSVTMEILLRIAEIEYTELKDYKKALASYEQYIEKFPSAKKRIGVLFQIAQIYVKHEREYSRALDTYTDISNAYPQTKWDEKSKLAQADILSQYLSDFQGAIAAYRDLVENNFESSFAADALYKIARIHDRELNDDQSAIIVYQEIIERFPNNSLANTARHEIERIRRR